MHQQDVETLKAEYATVKQVFDALGDGIRGESGWPLYPRLVSDFMQSLSKPPRGRPDYQPDRMMEIEANIAMASTEDIQHLLTAYGRVERFSDGAWITILSENRLEPVIKRLEQLASEES